MTQLLLPTLLSPIKICLKKCLQDVVKSFLCCLWLLFIELLIITKDILVQCINSCNIRKRNSVESVISPWLQNNKSETKYLPGRKSYWQKNNYAGRETASFIKLQAIKCSFVIYTPFLSRNRESNLLFHRVPADGFVTTRLPAWPRLPRQGCWAVARSGVSPQGSWHCLLSHSLLLFLCFQRADNPRCCPDKQESGPRSTPVINTTVAGSLPVFISSAPVPSYMKGSPGNA